MSQDRIVAKRIGVLLFLLIAQATPAGEAPLTSKPVYQINFGEQCGHCDWFVVVDGVMGGRSVAELTPKSNSIELAGDISLDNQGGFASIRPPYTRLDLSAFQGVSIRYRSVGQSFALTLNNYKRFFMPRFKTVLPETNWRWSSVTIPFTDFKKMRFEKVLGGGPDKKALKNIIRLGLISNDKREGPFRLEVDFIEFRESLQNSG